MTIFAEVTPEGEVIQFVEEFDLPSHGQNHFYEVPAFTPWRNVSSTEKLMWVNGTPTWVETATLAELRERAVQEIDAFADAARLSVVGDAARIKEYETAQRDAEEYRDAGFTGPVPLGVSTWAYAKRRDNWTARQAAEDILAASARWHQALYGIRGLRLDAKEAARFAATGEEAATSVATLSATLTAALMGVK